MPQLLRLRLVSVGHRAARLDDLTLDFRDADGRATDSTLWLRNGGGKSSILNLFFAIMRPHRHEFLGGQSEARQRSLDDYILAGDRSVTAAEWSLDAAADTLGFEGERLITGVFYERREAGGELRRLFFAARVSPSQPQSTLEGLPLYLSTGGGGRHRATLTGFREAWLGLRDRAPHLGVSATDNQREWQEVLEGARIDPELFSYQVRMNRREGGVDELFRFASAEDFVDFLLGMALEPALAGDVGRNIAAWRSELVRRQEVVQPERELVARMLARVTELSEVSGWRGRLRERLARVCAEISRQERLVVARQAELAAEAAAMDDNERQQAGAAAAGRRAAARDRGRAAGLRRHSSHLRLRGHQDELRSVEEQLREQRRLAKIWRAAEPLRGFLRFEQSAATHRRLLEHRQREHAPLRAELGLVATRLAGALAYVIRELRQAAGNARLDEAAARDQAREYRGQAAEEQSLVKLARARAVELEGLLEKARVRAHQLVERGFLEANEGAHAGLVRWSEALHAREEAVEQTKLELERLEVVAEALERGIQAAAAEGATLRARADGLEKRLREATDEREALERDAVLQAALELESIDADRLAPEALDTLDRAARNEQRAVVAVRLEAMQDQQALEHLTEWGLLPPAGDVRRAVELLRGQLAGQAWSGWEWLAANVPAEERALLARRAPYLAEGVVVREDDLQRAADVLRQARMQPAGPLAVVPADGGRDAATDEVGTLGGRWPELPAVVVGPGEAALYDRAAGLELREQLGARVSEVEGLIRSAERKYQELVRARQAVRSFRDRYSEGWFAHTANELAAAQSDHSEQAVRLDELRRARCANYKERSELVSRREQLEQQVRRAQEAAQALEAHVLDYLNPVAEWRRELANVQRQAQESAAEAKQWEGMAQEMESRAELQAGQAQEQGEAASRYEEELRRVAYLETRPVPEQGSLDVLRTDYENLKATYERRVGAEQLAALAQQDEINAKEQRRRLDRLLSEEVTEEVIRLHLTQLPNPDDIDSLREQAEGSVNSLSGSAERLKHCLQAESEALAQAEQLCSELGVTETLERVPGSPHLADGEATQLEEAARVTEAAADEDDRSAATSREHARTLRARAEELERLAERLGGVIADYGDLFTGLPHSAADAGTDTATSSVYAADGPGQQAQSTALDEAAVVQYVRRATVELRVMREEWNKLNEQRSLLAAEVRSVAGGASAVVRQQAQWIDRVLAHPESELEDNSARLVEQLALRRQTLDDLLAEIDQHRAVLATELLRVAKDGLHLLKQATQLSRLPEGVTGLGGAQFLRITTDEPADDQEQLSRMAQLVDELARGDRELDGIKLAQASVRRLARRIQVRVMHPDPALQRQVVSIPEMARFSGGEQLTGAILLYCTLANVRGRARGQTRRPSSVLVLDNPIGRASRVQFLRLQREVARAMGVQLIYTTAVNDHEALSALPNMIRLRNERVDRNTGKRLVEHAADEGAESEAGVLRAARVGRRESAAPAALFGTAANVLDPNGVEVGESVDGELASDTDPGSDARERDRG